jgi:hydrogenase maturation protein HypF
MHQGIKHLAFSGGVFQNALLTDLILKRLGNNYKMYFHKQLSPNDECIGFGQLAYHEIQNHKAILLKERKLKTETL